MSGWLLLVGGVVVLSAGILVVAASRVTRSAAALVGEVGPPTPAAERSDTISSDLLVRIEDMVERSPHATVPDDPPR